MTDPSNDLAQRIAMLAADRESGASELLLRAIDILHAARMARIPVLPIAKGICRAQPSMAPLWNAAVEAVRSETEPERFDRFVQRIQRSQVALARFAVDCFATDNDPLRLVTISASRAVSTVFTALHARRHITVACSESRPAGEGRTLARRLSASRVPVTFFSDAAIAHALAGSNAVVVGADAVASEWFLNKSGTHMLAAAAAQLGVPVYVAATRDKFIGPEIADRLLIREGAPQEIWEAAPDGVEVRNPYFERIPADVVTSVISDIGVLGIGMMRDVCGPVGDAATVEALAALAG